MDFATYFDPKATKWIDLKIPGTNKRIGVSVEVKSDYHPDVQASDRALMIKAVSALRSEADEDEDNGKKSENDKLPTLDEFHDTRAEKAVARTASWKWGDNTFGDLGTPDNTVAHKRKVWHHDGMQPFIQQVLDGAASFGNFTNG